MKKKSFSKIETYISADDFEKFQSISKERRQAKSATAREAIHWYIANHHRFKENKNETELTQSIKSMTDRICGMLARQGTQTGTLFELAWQNHVENNMQDRFVAATNTVKSNLRKRLEQDEKDIATRLKGVVEK